jgi:nucleotide-binding universal stress UspA family protein
LSPARNTDDHDLDQIAASGLSAPAARNRLSRSPFFSLGTISMNASFRSILHPTDFSDLSGAAFAHALRIALAARCKLRLLHIAEHNAEASAFPNVQRLLVQWGLSEEGDPPSAVSTRLGLDVDNISLEGKNPAQGIVGFLSEHASDLVVIATHGRDGIDHWLEGSVSEAVFRGAAIPTLFMTHGARGFVSQVSGDIRLKRVLVPVDFAPAPGPAIEAVRRFARLMTGGDVIMHLVHVGNTAPPVPASSSNAAGPPSVMLRSGDVVKSIVDAAIEYDVDFIGMPTAGHQGVLDALRGSTTERVIRHAPCPVLAVPAA